MSQLATHNPTQKSFGFWTATCLVIGNMIGSGIFFLPTSLALIGPISIGGWILTSLGAISLAFVFAKLSRHNPAAGGPFIHTRHAFGDFFGFLMAWGYWIMVWSSNGGIALAFVSYLSHFFPLINTYPLAIFACAVSLVWVITLINCVSLRYGGSVQILTVLIKLTPLVLVGIGGCFYIDTSLYTPLIVNDQTPIAAIVCAASITMWAFLGLEAATVPADNVQNADKIIPRATIIGTSITALLYIGITIVLFGLIPSHDLAASSAPFMLAATKVFGEMAPVYLGVCILVSVFGALNGWILLQGHIPLVLAQEGFMPKIFAYKSKNGTPIVGLLFSSILVTIMLALNLENSLNEQFNTIILVGAVTTLIAYMMTALAALKLFNVIRNPLAHLPIIFAAGIGIAYSLGAIIGAGSKIMLICAVCYLICLPIYWYYSRQRMRSKLSNESIKIVN